MKVLSIVGARPQFVKAATVCRALSEKARFEHQLVHTGQHYDDNMSDVFFEELDIPAPDHHLGIGGGTHGQNTGRMLEALERVLLQEKPDWVLVYGDTDSTLAGALAAVKLHIRTAHVEAGLRSFNRRMPEEINRVLTDHASALLFAPTAAAVDNLRKEGIEDGRIHLVGDVMYDAALYYAGKAERESSILERLGLTPRRYLLATLHRAENTDDPSRLEVALRALMAMHPDMPVVLPLHPRTRKAAERSGLAHLLHNLTAIDPVGYLDMVMLEKNAALIATDSGGVQKEAFFFRVPCVTLREETEWVELVEANWNRLAPPKDWRSVVRVLRESLGKNGRDVAPYGLGDAATQIAQVLAEAHG
jgi:UDP-GlcNAc3NAcA epimerase